MRADSRQERRALDELDVLEDVPALRVLGGKSRATGASRLSKSPERDARRFFAVEGDVFRFAPFRRYDELPDAVFYRRPRFVEHIDAGAIAAVTQLHRELFPPGGVLLDLMSSWVSHLPPEVAYGRVVGVGMNEAELAANPRLDERLVHDLNAQPALPFGADSFDGAQICVSIQYLTRPVEVLRDLARVLRPGAPLAIAFSNRCFPAKAVAAWQQRDDRGRAELVASYLRDAGGWTAIEALDRSPGDGDPLFAVVARAADA